MKKIFTSMGIAALILVWLGLTAAAWFGEPEEMSVSERRKLEQAPKLSIETLLAEDDYRADGTIRKKNSFMSLFEEYSLDQFPLRDRFRQVKSVFTYYVMQQKDNNEIYVEDGYAAKLLYPLDEDRLNDNLKILNTVVQQQIIRGKCKLYVAVVPDKSFYLAEENGYLSMDYEKMFDAVQKKFPTDKLPNATHIDLTDCLSIDSYYRTDTHWRQEELIPVANKIAQAMGVTVQQESDYTIQQVERPFYGVYYGHAALPMDPEPLYLMQSDLLDACKVYAYDEKTGVWNENSQVYNLEKLEGNDLYEVFLSGNLPLLRIDNPNAGTDKELIVFRDSFGSSLTPLLMKDYKSVTLVDLRLVDYKELADYITFKGQDVLFLYNTQVLNQAVSK